MTCLAIAQEIVLDRIDPMLVGIVLCTYTCKLAIVRLHAYYTAQLEQLLSHLFVWIPGICFHLPRHAQAPTE